jgi:hypothetical protein
VAENESVFRDVNEGIEESVRRFGIKDRATFLCECGDPACSEPLMVTLSEYEAVREHPARFVVKPGHEQLDVERVVDRHGAYSVVEKTAEAGRDRARSLDRRSAPPS